MTWWKDLLRIFKSEASDVKEGLSHVGRSLDSELAKKEAEMAASPSERVDMILDEIESSDPLGEIEAKIKGTQSDIEAENEIEAERTSSAEIERDPPAER
ncbi:MAG: hypothetical protein HKO76_01055 [Acidimicrobiia bacterium]|nr:hypothetical protein [Acidimicrobiia bacterium]